MGSDGRVRHGSTGAHRTCGMGMDMPTIDTPLHDPVSCVLGLGRCPLGAGVGGDLAREDAESTTNRISINDVIKSESKLASTTFATYISMYKLSRIRITVVRSSVVCRYDRASIALGHDDSLHGVVGYSLL
jgi:hypothetical protein